MSRMRNNVLESRCLPMLLKLVDNKMRYFPSVYLVRSKYIHTWGEIKSSLDNHAYCSFLQQHRLCFSNAIRYWIGPRVSYVRFTVLQYILACYHMAYYEPAVMCDERITHRPKRRVARKRCHPPWPNEWVLVYVDLQLLYVPLGSYVRKGGYAVVTCTPIQCAERTTVRTHHPKFKFWFVSKPYGMIPREALFRLWSLDVYSSRRPGNTTHNYLSRYCYSSLPGEQQFSLHSNQLTGGYAPITPEAASHYYSWTTVMPW